MRTRLSVTLCLYCLYFFFTNVFSIAIYSPIVCSVEIGQRVAIWGVSSTYWTVLSAKWQILAA
jgi:hypothetical protein